MELKGTQGEEVVVGARQGEPEGGGGVAFWEPVLEFVADAGLEFGDAREVGGLPLRKFGWEMDRRGTVSGIGSEIVDGSDDAIGVEMPLSEEAISGEAAV